MQQELNLAAECAQHSLAHASCSSIYIIRMPFGLANAGSVYSSLLDVAMKEVDRDFWKSYVDDILTFSGEPWAHFGHLS